MILLSVALDLIFGLFEVKLCVILFFDVATAAVIYGLVNEHNAHILFRIFLF